MTCKRIITKCLQTVWVHDIHKGLSISEWSTNDKNKWSLDHFLVKTNRVFTSRIFYCQFLLYSNRNFKVFLKILKIILFTQKPIKNKSHCSVINPAKPHFGKIKMYFNFSLSLSLSNTHTHACVHVYTCTHSLTQTYLHTKCA